MEFCGELVEHKEFGKGQIVEFTNNHVTVLFDDSKSEKKFTYPSAFGAFLEAENKSFLKEIEEDKNAIVEKEAETKRINEELIQVEIKAKSKGAGSKYSKKNTAKTSDKNNIAFKCNYSDDVNSKEFIGYKGVCSDEKRTSMSIRNVKANSLALLTTKIPYAKERDRIVVALFLIDENYNGDDKDGGHVAANPKYKMQLSIDEAKELKFWDYYFNLNRPEKIIFGSGLHRYLTDTQSAQVLEKICEIKKGTLEEDLSKEFLEHYCEIKKLDRDNILIPNGALKRIVSETDNLKKKCPAFGQDFGGDDFFALSEMTLFEFSVGGYFGTSHSIFINAKLKNKVIRYAKTPGGMSVDMKKFKNDTNLNPDIILKEIPITSEQWDNFIDELTTLELGRWKDKYNDNNICDETQWELILRFPNRNKLSKCGSNEYPPYWNKFIEVLNKYTNENIGNE